jgi:hypothetical protein
MLGLARGRNVLLVLVRGRHDGASPLTAAKRGVREADRESFSSFLRIERKGKEPGSRVCESQREMRISKGDVGSKNREDKKIENEILSLCAGEASRERERERAGGSCRWGK